MVLSPTVSKAIVAYLETHGIRRATRPITRRQQIEEAWHCSSDMDNVGGGRTNSPSQAVMNKAITLATLTDPTEVDTVYEIVEIVYQDHLTPELQQFVQYCYFDPGGNQKKACQQMHVDETMGTHYKREALLRFAVGLGLA